MKNPTHMPPHRKPPSFLSGVFLLTLSTLLVKATGLITKIPLLHLLGAEGMGYYNTAYEVYAFLFVLSTAGLPVALSILISEDRDGGRARRRVLVCATRLFVLIGLVGGGALFLFADHVALWMGNAGAADCMRAVAPAVLFICLSSAIRGYYQGLQDMKPTALSQVLEAVGKLVCGLGFASWARRMGSTLAQIAAAGAAGLSAGTLLSLGYLLLKLYTDTVKARQVPSNTVARDRRPVRGVSKRLLRIAIPITVSSGVLTLTRLLDMILILRRLQTCGYTEAAVNMLYGAYSTLAIPLYSLLPTMIGSVALPLVPGIARARELGDTDGERDVVTASFRLTILLGLPATLGLSAFSGPILRLLFRGEDTAIRSAQPLLTILGISVLGACLMTVTNAMLQAYHRPRVPLVSMLVGSLLKLGCAWLLLGLPQVGMAGAPISTFVCNFAVVMINLTVLCRMLPRGCGITGFCLRTLGASVVAVGGSLALWLLVNRNALISDGAFLALLALCVVLYFFLILRLGVLTRADVERLSHGEHLWSLFQRLKLVRSGETSADFLQKGDKLRKTT